MSSLASTQKTQKQMPVQACVTVECQPAKPKARRKARTRKGFLRQVIADLMHGDTIPPTSPPWQSL